MANPLPCDSCNEEAGAVIITLVESGETQSLGARCFPVFCLETARAALSVEQLADLLGPIFVQAPQTGSRGRGGRKRGQEAPDTSEGAGADPGSPAPQGEASSEEAAEV